MFQEKYNFLRAYSHMIRVAMWLLASLRLSPSSAKDRRTRIELEFSCANCDGCPISISFVA